MPHYNNLHKKPTYIQQQKNGKEHNIFILLKNKEDDNWLKVDRVYKWKQFLTYQKKKKPRFIKQSLVIQSNFLPFI